MDNFNKADLMYNACSFIREARDKLIGDLVSYHDDSVRFMRRARLISQLDLYESQLVLKIYNFTPDELSNNKEFEDIIKLEIRRITDISS